MNSSSSTIAFTYRTESRRANAQPGSKLDLKPELTTRCAASANLDGLPLDARSVTDELSTMEGK